MKLTFEKLVKKLATSTDYKASLPPFAKEDEFIMNKFGLQDLRASYNSRDFIPEDISKAVAAAYQFVNPQKKYKNYLKDSTLGRKIQGAVTHDYQFILNFLDPIAKPIDFSDPEWNTQVHDQINDIPSKTMQKKTQETADICLERIRRYPLPKKLPKHWK